MPDSNAAALAGLADERFVSLTTFRRTGEPVSTPVWIAANGTDLIVTTPKESGKVKRRRTIPGCTCVRVPAPVRRGRVPSPSRLTR